MNAKIYNRQAVAPRTKSWQQIEVTGEHRGTMVGADGKETRIVQVIDEAAIANIAKDFRAIAADPYFDGLLVDADHLSHDLSEKTEAYAWLMNVEVRDGQLWGELEWTDLGASAISGNRYKYFSTEYGPGDFEVLGSGRVRPSRLSGLSLTNRPNNKGGRRIQNRSQTATEDPGHNPTQDDKTTMKNIAEKLGLPAEATEEEILAKITALQEKADKADGMEAEVKAEEILNRNAKRIPAGQRDAWKKELLLNRESAERMILTLPEAKEEEAEAKGRERVFNREGAKHPDGKANSQGDDAATAAEEAKAARISNRARELTKSGYSTTAAYMEAQTQIQHEDAAAKG